MACLLISTSIKALWHTCLQYCVRYLPRWLGSTLAIVVDLPARGSIPILQIKNVRWNFGSKRTHTPTPTPTPTPTTLRAGITLDDSKRASSALPTYYLPCYLATYPAWVALLPIPSGRCHRCLVKPQVAYRSLAENLVRAIHAPVIGAFRMPMHILWPRLAMLGSVLPYANHRGGFKTQPRPSQMDG
ncbi:hypothetical protein LX36DRAFT_56785 [Colletotrichum falcatum]|nr:hypothetical protein LX36DRAFT_56785 [Colletotrichum falcatum]